MYVDVPIPGIGITLVIVALIFFFIVMRFIPGE